ncbi:outer membrane efflux protein [Spirochaetia bacterium]|nr:outer membrane efflux protein [Spirochaetia bacterium]
MKRNFVTVILFFAVIFFAEAGEYDLAAYLARVKQYNPDIALAAKELALAKTSVTQARAAFLPGIGIQGGYNHNFIDSMRSTPVASSPGGGRLIYQDVDSNYDNELTFGIGVTQTLFDAGVIANYDKARKGQAIREASSEAVKQNIQSAAKKLYAQTQLVLMVVEIMEASEQLSRDIYESTERKYRAGADTELNLLMAEVDWKTKMTSTAEAQKNTELALIAFRNLAGIPLSETITLTEPSEDLPEIPDAPALETVLGIRHDYRILSLSREMADIDRRAAIGAFLPTASASFSYALGGMGNGGSLVGDYDFDSAALSLKVSIPLFAGGYRLAKMKAAKLEQEKADIALLNKRDAIESDLSKLSLRFKEAVQRVESARLIAAAAERAVSLSQTAYANGLATQLTVADAVNKLGAARLGLHSAIFEYRASYYDWENTAGLVK